MLSREQIIEQLGIEQVDAETQTLLLQQLSDAVAMRMMSHLSERLSEADLAQLDQLVDDQQEDAVVQLLRSKVPDYDAFAAQVQRNVMDELAADRQTVEARRRSDIQPNA